jgi:hypothetical protein
VKRKADLAIAGAHGRRRLFAKIALGEDESMQVFGVAQPRKIHGIDMSLIVGGNIKGIETYLFSSASGTFSGPPKRLRLSRPVKR